MIFISGVSSNISADLGVQSGGTAHEITIGIGALLGSCCKYNGNLCLSY